MPPVLAKTLLTLAAFAAAISLTACGGSDPTSANVNGTWSIASSGDAPKASWKITSSCESGPCDFKTNMGLGQVVTFKWDESKGEYTSVSSATSDCYATNGKDGAKNALKVSTTSTFTPTEADGDNATAADVTAKMKVTVSAAGKKAGCKAGGAIPPTTQKATRDGS